MPTCFLFIIPSSGTFLSFGNICDIRFGFPCLILVLTELDKK